MVVLRLFSPVTNTFMFLIFAGCGFALRLGGSCWFVCCILLVLGLV